MNKVPDIEVIQNVTSFKTTVNNQKGRNNEAGEKHSAHVTHRTRIPPISQNLKMQANLSRLNLKTREELVTKENKLLKSIVAPRDSFDVSVDLSPIREGVTESGFAILR